MSGQNVAEARGDVEWAVGVLAGGATPPPQPVAQPFWQQPPPAAHAPQPWQQPPPFAAAPPQQWAYAYQPVAMPVAYVHQPVVMMMPVFAPLKSKATAALLAFFLGVFGAHNFYLGKTGLAITQLCFTIFGACLYGLGPAVVGVWAFVEFILILTGSVRDNLGRPLTG